MKQKLIINSLIWIKNNLVSEIEAQGNNDYNYYKYYEIKKIIEKNKNCGTAQKLGYKRRVRNIDNNGETHYYHYFQRFTYLFCPYTKKLITQPHRATHRNKIIKLITNKLFSNWFNNMVDNRSQLPIEKGNSLGEDCPICCEELYSNTTTTTQCNHKFCRDCIAKWCLSIQCQRNGAKCPVCRTIIPNY